MKYTVFYGQILQFVGNIYPFSTLTYPHRLHTFSPPTHTCVFLHSLCLSSFLILVAKSNSFIKKIVKSKIID